MLCGSSDRGVAYFGYRNTGSAPVTIPVGPANHITAADGTVLTTNQTAVFAPGTHGVSAWVSLEGENPSATWSVLGADGVAQTAVANASSLIACPQGLPPLDAPDNRTADYASSVDVTRDSAGHVSAANVTISLGGLATNSPCPAGSYPWTPAPPEIRLFADGTFNATVVDGPDRSVLRIHIDDPHSPLAEFVKAEGFASINLAADVYDHCHDAAGTISSAWGASSSLITLSQFDGKLCFGAVDDAGQPGYGVVDCVLGPGLPQTGGIRTR